MSPMRTKLDLNPDDIRTDLPTQSKNSSSDPESESLPKLSILQFATCMSKLLMEVEPGEWSPTGWCHLSSLLFVILRCGFGSLPSVSDSLAGEWCKELLDFDRTGLSSFFSMLSSVAARFFAAWSLGYVPLLRWVSLSGTNSEMYFTIWQLSKMCS